MLSFTSSLSPRTEGLVVFINDKYEYKDKKSILSNSLVLKINSFLSLLKKKKSEEEISSFDASDKVKFFIVKVKNKYESYFPQELGGSFYSYLKKFKHINEIDFYVDSLDFDKEKLVSFISQFTFGFNLKSYTFTKYKTSDKEKNNKKINFKINFFVNFFFIQSFVFIKCVAF